MSYQFTITARPQTLDYTELHKQMQNQYGDDFKGVEQKNGACTFFFDTEKDSTEQAWITSTYESCPTFVPDQNKFRVYLHVDPRFKFFPHHAVDFRRHLAAPVALKKRPVEKDARFRPTHVDYELEGVLIARLKWTFTDDAAGFMTNRKEEIAYYQNDGELGPYFKKKEKDYTQSVIGDQIEVIEERRKARQDCLSHFKIVIIGALQTQFPASTMQSLYDIGGAFWSAHESAINAFVETASAAFRAALVAADETQTPNELLDYEVPGAPGLKVRDYMIATLDGMEPQL